MRYVPAGTFTQGSPSTEPCRISDETQFVHTLTRNLAVMETEITRQMWADLKAVQATLTPDFSNPTFSPTLNHPAQFNSWHESLLFANLLSLQNGYTRCYYIDETLTTPLDATNFTISMPYCDFDATGYRLPSEGEWEYFCRAGTTTPFSCNETNYTTGNCSSCTLGTHPTLEQHGVYCANDPGMTVPVGGKLPNPWNLKDVHGNVWEWCFDRYWVTYPVGPVTDYLGPLEYGFDPVIRGGSFADYPENCRSAKRFNFRTTDRHYCLGFRLLRTTD